LPGFIRLRGPRDVVPIVLQVLVGLIDRLKQRREARRILDRPQPIECRAEQSHVVLGQ